jgi:hypothetical protein
VLHVTEVLIELDGRLKTALSRRTLLEAALVRAARCSTVTPLEDLLKKINALGGVAQVDPAGVAGRVAPPSPPIPSPSSPLPSPTPVADRDAILSKPSVVNALDILGGIITDIQ